jgi:Ca-activated chloride channel family protein
MDLAPGRDQVAIVRFDSAAEVVQQLSSDRESVAAAISGLQVRQGTHIDKGLRAALRELQSDRRNPANTAVAVLLTDGIHNGEPGAELAAAQDVREAGIRLYTIGLGADVDETALETMAGDSRRYYFAPDSSELASIYGEIAHDIACPAEQFWPVRR